MYLSICKTPTTRDDQQADRLSKPTRRFEHPATPSRAEGCDGEKARELTETRRGDRRAEEKPPERRKGARKGSKKGAEELEASSRPSRALPRRTPCHPLPLVLLRRSCTLFLARYSTRPLKVLLVLLLFTFLVPSTLFLAPSLSTRSPALRVYHRMGVISPPVARWLCTPPRPRLREPDPLSSRANFTK